jgi:hypothetical protein
MNAILAPIMEKVLDLGQDGGYQFTINGEKRSFSGTIAFVSGDNLGSQELGGFTVGPGSHLKCRDCLGTTEDIKTKVVYIVCIIIYIVYRKVSEFWFI